jgi:putative transposase
MGQSVAESKLRHSSIQSRAASEGQRFCDGPIRHHEALGQVVPAVVYTPSPRPYPARLEEPSYPAEFELRRVRSNGEIKWQGELIFISGPLIGEVIGLRETDDGNAEAYFGPVHLGTIDGASLKFSPVRPARPPRRSSVLPSDPGSKAG